MHAFPNSLLSGRPLGADGFLWVAWQTSLPALIAELTRGFVHSICVNRKWHVDQDFASGIHLFHAGLHYLEAQARSSLLSVSMYDRTVVPADPESYRLPRSPAT
jgi:hypothetical protein